MIATNVYEEFLIRKGYTLAEIRQVPATVDKRVPAHLRDRYSSFEEYCNAVHDFVNAN